MLILFGKETKKILASFMFVYASEADAHGNLWHRRSKILTSANSSVVAIKVYTVTHTFDLLVLYVRQAFFSSLHTSRFNYRTN
jgi:hypothetical protein